MRPASRDEAVAKMRSFIALAVLAIVGCSIAEARPQGTVIPYIVYDGYFVSNQFEPNAADSFVVLQDQTTFDRVFGISAVMYDRSRRLEPNTLSNRIVIAVIHRGHADVRYRVISATRDGTILRINYTTILRQTPLTEYACPLILSVARDNYSAVAFIENGKLLKTVPVSR